MEIISEKNGENWNAFVRAHYPPVGAFMQTWEWGEFQKALGRKTERYRVLDGKDSCAIFTLVHHSLPFGLSYGYVPRGPVVAVSAASRKVEILRAIKVWAKQNFSHFTFFRLEPPLFSIPAEIASDGFHIPSYYVQPRFNAVVSLDRSEDEILSGFHPSTRSNIRRAENRGVTIERKYRMEKRDYDIFFAMAKDTIARNSGVNAYPGEKYFHALVRCVPPIADLHSKDNLSMGIFYGYQGGEPAGAHLVLFFGDTATYLYGASYSDKLRSKVTTYLHWAAIKESKIRGIKYYDLGGVDATRWPTLTSFKRQFRGEEFKYVGNIDIPVRPVLHRFYDTIRNLRK